MAVRKRTRTHRLDWIDSGNPRQVHWALEYLIKKGLSPVGTYSTERALQEIDRVGRSWPLHGTEAIYFEKIEATMRGAWASRKYEDKHRHQKVYTFRMSRDLLPRLEKLASRNMNVSEAVEDLIRGGLDQAKRIKELELEVRQLRQPFARRGAFDPIRGQHLITQLREKNKYQEGVAAEWKTISEHLALELARSQVALKALGAYTNSKRLTLSPDDESAAVGQQRRWMDAYEAKVKSALKLGLHQMDSEATPEASTDPTPSAPLAPRLP